MISRRKIFGWFAGLLGGAVAMPTVLKASALQEVIDAKALADSLFSKVLKPEGGATQVMTLPELKWLSSGATWDAYGVKNAKAPPYIPKLLMAQDLYAWADALPNTYCTTYADPPVNEYALAVRCRTFPPELALATDALIRTMQHVINAFRLGAGGDKVPLIWRIKPDLDMWKGEIVEYREDGPDICDATDKRCVRDMSIAYVKIRARFGADNLPSGTIVSRAERDGIPQGWELVERVPRDLAVRIRKI